MLFRSAAYWLCRIPLILLVEDSKTSLRSSRRGLRTHTHDWPYVVPLSLQVTQWIVPSVESKVRIKIRILFIIKLRMLFIRKIHFDKGIPKWSSLLGLDYRLPLCGQR